MPEVECPVDECEADFQADSWDEVVSSVRGHINGSPDPLHDWKGVADQLDGPPQGGKSPDGENAKEAGEGVNDPDEEGYEGVNEPDGEGDKGVNDQDMPTDSELERQREQVESPDQTGEDDQEEGGNEGAPDADGGGGHTSPSKGGIPLPVDSTTVLIGAAIGLALLLLFVYTRSSSSMSADQNDSDSGPSSSMGDGLVDAGDVDWDDLERGA